MIPQSKITIRSLVSTFRDLDRDKAANIIALIKKPSIAEQPKEWHGSGSAIERALYHIDKLLDNHGVEYAKPENAEHDHNKPRGIEYSNSGDMYNGTIFYDYLKGRFYLGCLGDVIETDKRWNS
jgi:hypothetical protein